MIEIFKTNVQSADHAVSLIRLIHETFNEYVANFDLEDDDRILRVKSKVGTVEPAHVVKLIEKSGFKAEILPDDYPLSFIRAKM